MMFDIPLPCTEGREIRTSGIVDEADGYLSPVAVLVHHDEVAGLTVHTGLCHPEGKNVYRRSGRLVELFPNGSTNQFRIVRTRPVIAAASTIFLTELQQQPSIISHPIDAICLHILCFRDDLRSVTDSSQQRYTNYKTAALPLKELSV